MIGICVAYCEWLQYDCDSSDRTLLFQPSHDEQTTKDAWILPETKLITAQHER